MSIGELYNNKKHWIELNKDVFIKQYVAFVHGDTTVDTEFHLCIKQLIIFLGSWCFLFKINAHPDLAPSEIVACAKY